MANAEGSTSRTRDILSRQSELETERGQYEAVWEQVAEFCDPDAPDVWSGRRTGGPDSQAERQERRGARVYANTINSAANRLAAGLESLIIPQSEKWHGLTIARPGRRNDAGRSRNNRRLLPLPVLLRVDGEDNNAQRRRAAPVPLSNFEGRGGAV